MLRRIEYWLRKFEYQKRMKAIEEVGGVKRTFIFATPLHRNLGDHLITVAERRFLKNITCSNTVFEIPEEVYKMHKEKLQRIIKKDDLLIINGGGFIGNIWLGEQMLLEDVLKTFSENKVVIFPQTIFFDDSKPNYEERLTALKNCLTNHKNTILFVREENSYRYALNNFSDTKVLLVPDIALSYYDVTPIASCATKKSICLCLRNDVENARDERKINSISNLAQKHGLRIVLSDTIAKSRVFERYREEYVQKKIQEFSAYNLVITDRLHGMIFAYLAGTHCLFLDNKTKKVSGVYNKWLRNCDSIRPFNEFNNDSDIEAFIERSLKNNFVSNAPIDMHYFDILRDEVLANE